MTIINDIFGANGVMAANIPGYVPRPGQMLLANTIFEGMTSDRHVLAEGPCGCHVAGQEILMADGTLRRVEDIVVGDFVMGTSSQPRRVLELHRGVQETVTIIPTKGAPWTVNVDHILTLVRYDNGTVSDVSVRNWFSLSRTQKALNKLFREPVIEFAGPRTAVTMDPYFLGVLIGDGSMSGYVSVTVSKPDPEIRKLMYEQAEIYGLRIREFVSASNVPGYAIVGDMGNKDNPVTAELRALGLRGKTSGDKFIPWHYKTGDWNTRREIFAGLMDTDGHLASGCYDYISKSKQLADDVAFVARSLGLAAYITECEKSCQGGFTGTYHRVSISGNLDIIPCRIPRKKAAPSKQQKNRLRTGFLPTITGKVEPYFGFTLDGDGRYLLGDFTVTHNSGKSFAYLVPAIHHTVNQGGRVVIATANIALQEQLIKKDLPTLATALAGTLKFRYALLKGVNNYVCQTQLKTATSAVNQKALFQSREVFAEFSNIIDWAETTTTGDVSELDFVPSGMVWSKLSVSADDCLKRDCPNFDGCFAMNARKAAQTAEVIVTNYHMLFAHAAIVAAGGEGILPAFDVLVCDEAHEAADIAREFFGINVSLASVNAFAAQAASELKGVEKVARELKDEAEVFFSFLRDYANSDQYRIRLRKPEFVNDSLLMRKIESITKRLEKAEEDELDTKRKKKLGMLMIRASNLSVNIRECVRQENGDCVYWIEQSDKGGARLRSKPVYVGQLLRERIFDNIPSVTCVSATMTTGDAESPSAFEFVRKELGCPEDCLRVVGPSPFDFSKQAMVIVPTGMPSPSDTSNYVANVALMTERVVKLAEGRTLGLFTSYKNLNTVYGHIANTSGYRVMKQGDMPRAELTRIFKQDESSVLLGTDSFWTGVDVPGDACVCVVIDRLPFTHPDDPVCNAITERDKNAFTNYHIPQAVIALRQGVGRLIRTITDVGVVVILDHRIISTKWGNQYFWSSMPRGIHARQDLNMIPEFIAWAKTAVLTESA